MATKRILILGLTLIMALIGLWLALQSPTLARGAADSLLRSSGGSMATETYLALLASYAAAYRLVGAVLLAVGSFFALQMVSRQCRSE